MTRDEDVLPGRVPILCWRCGRDCAASFDLIKFRGSLVAVCKAGDPTCVPTLVKETR